MLKNVPSLSETLFEEHVFKIHSKFEPVRGSEIQWIFTESETLTDSNLHGRVLNTRERFEIFLMWLLLRLSRKQSKTQNDDLKGSFWSFSYQLFCWLFFNLPIAISNERARWEISIDMAIDLERYCTNPSIIPKTRICVYEKYFYLKKPAGHPLKKHFSFIFFAIIYTEKKGLLYQQSHLLK